MGHDYEGQRMYQQFPERTQSGGIYNTCSASTIFSRLGHSSTVQATSATQQSHALRGPKPGFLDPGHYAASPMQVQIGYHDPQYTINEPIGNNTPHPQHTTQYSQVFFHNNQQAACLAKQVSEEHMQRYQSTVGWDHSITSTCSEYSFPKASQLQDLGLGQAQPYQARTERHQALVSHEMLPYTQSTSHSGQYHSAEQILAPSIFSGYEQQWQQQQIAYTNPDMDEAYETYQTKARKIFSLVQEGRLQDTHEPLLHISQYLLGNAEALGLDKDDKRLHNERLKLWDMFNHIWLTTLQAQLDQIQDMVTRGDHAPQPPKSLLDVCDMEEMGQELVRLCDEISTYGLVDYQMGVAEEAIVECECDLDPDLPYSMSTAGLSLYSISQMP